MEQFYRSKERRQRGAHVIEMLLSKHLQLYQILYSDWLNRRRKSIL
jgi:hypothetical protein